MVDRLAKRLAKIERAHADRDVSARPVKLWNFPRVPADASEAEKEDLLSRWRAENGRQPREPVTYSTTGPGHD